MERTLIHRTLYFYTNGWPLVTRRWYKKELQPIYWRPHHLLLRVQHTQCGEFYIWEVWIIWKAPPSASWLVGRSHYQIFSQDCWIQKICLNILMVAGRDRSVKQDKCVIKHFWIELFPQNINNNKKVVRLRYVSLIVQTPYKYLFGFLYMERGGGCYRQCS